MSEAALDRFIAVLHFGPDASVLTRLSVPVDRWGHRPVFIAFGKGLFRQTSRDHYALVPDRCYFAGSEDER